MGSKRTAHSAAQSLSSFDLLIPGQNDGIKEKFAIR